MRGRVPSARPVTVAMLKGYRLRFQKASKDGSAKANASYTGDRRNHVWGVVYEIDPTEKPRLDQAEGLGSGYEEKMICVSTRNKKEFEAVMYYATSVDASLKPYSWYVRCVVCGAEQHHLAPDYIAKVKTTKSSEDPNRKREAKELAVQC